MTLKPGTGHSRLVHQHEGMFMSPSKCESLLDYIDNSLETYRRMLVSAREHSFFRAVRVANTQKVLVKDCCVVQLYMRTRREGEGS